MNKKFIVLLSFTVSVLHMEAVSFIQAKQSLVGQVKNIFKVGMDTTSFTRKVSLPGFCFGALAGSYFYKTNFLPWGLLAGMGITGSVFLEAAIKSLSANSSIPNEVGLFLLPGLYFGWLSLHFILPIIIKQIRLEIQRKSLDNFLLTSNVKNTTGYERIKRIYNFCINRQNSSFVSPAQQARRALLQAANMLIEHRDVESLGDLGYWFKQNKSEYISIDFSYSFISSLNSESTLDTLLFFYFWLRYDSLKLEQFFKPTGNNAPVNYRFFSDAVRTWMLNKETKGIDLLFRAALAELPTENNDQYKNDAILLAMIARSASAIDYLLKEKIATVQDIMQVMIENSFLVEACVAKCLEYIKLTSNQLRELCLGRVISSGDGAVVSQVYQLAKEKKKKDVVVKMRNHFIGCYTLLSPKNKVENNKVENNKVENNKDVVVKMYNYFIGFFTLLSPNNKVENNKEEKVVFTDVDKQIMAYVGSDLKLSSQYLD